MTTPTQPVQLCEGVWETRSGQQVTIIANKARETYYGWNWIGYIDNLQRYWQNNGNFRPTESHSYDLVKLISPLPQQPAPEPQQLQLMPGIWKTREGHEVEVQENIGQLAKDFPWRGSLLGVTEIWRNNGRWMNNATDDHRDLVAYVQPLPRAESQTAEPNTNEKEPVIRKARKLGEFITEGTDGYTYWWPNSVRGPRGHLSSQQLRWLADELDKRNAERDNVVREDLERSSNSTEETEMSSTEGRDDLSQTTLLWQNAESDRRILADEVKSLRQELDAVITERDTLRRQFAAMTADRDRLQEQLQNTSEMQAGTEDQLRAELAELEYDVTPYEQTTPTKNVTIKVTMKIEPTISQMQEYIRQWAIRKGWLTETPRDPAQQLMLIVTELAECCEAFREGNPPCSRPGMEQYSHAAEELADVVIRCLQMAGEHNIPLSEVIEAKMAFNETRPTKHGKKF
jgi:NTP pyrophosphatase (non-canonical NTP hydrolase)